jgi:hypothetical protein
MLISDIYRWRAVGQLLGQPENASCGGYGKVRNIPRNHLPQLNFQKNFHADKGFSQVID